MIATGCHGDAAQVIGVQLVLQYKNQQNILKQVQNSKLTFECLFRQLFNKGETKTLK